MNFDELLENYEKELKIDLKIDRTDLATEQMKVLPIRQKWAARLVQYKAKLQRLKKKREKLKDQLIEEYVLNSKVKTPNRGVAAKAVEGDEKLTEIYDEMSTIELLVDYLGEVVDMCKSKHFALGNLIEITKLEYA